MLVLPVLLGLGALAWAVAAPARAARVSPAGQVRAKPASKPRSTHHRRARRRRVHRILYAHPKHLRRAKARALRRYRRGLRHRGGASRSTSLRFKASVFGGANALGIGPTGAIPPDSTGAIGPTHYVEFVNGEIAAYARSTLTSP